MKDLTRSSYFSDDTIVALSTPVGGAIAIVRASGSGCLSALKELSRKPCGFFEPRKAQRITLFSALGDAIDDAVAIFYKGPESYTGEDVIEYQIHGNDVIASRLIAELVSRNHRQAMPGEFSFRAVKNGKLSLSQAEAVSEVIGANSEESLSLALEKLSGTQQNLLSRLEKDLERLLALSEAGIDFSDQDLDETALDGLKTQVHAIREQLVKLVSSYDRGRKLNEGVAISIVGRPNAGKSSFFNALLGETRAIVSEIEGTTRDVVRERFLLKSKQGSVAVVLADTAGIRVSNDRIESIGIENAKKEGRAADLVLALVEPGTKRENFSEVLKAVDSQGAAVFGVLTKSDRFDSDSLSSRELEGWKKAFPENRWFSISSVTEAGFDRLVEEIVLFSTTRNRRARGEVLLTRLAHVDAVQKSLLAIERALVAQSHELVAADLRHALDALSVLVGKRVPDDILGQIFSSFCIGK